MLVPTGVGQERGGGAIVEVEHMQRNISEASCCQ